MSKVPEVTNHVQRLGIDWLGSLRVGLSLAVGCTNYLECYEMRLNPDDERRIGKDAPIYDMPPRVVDETVPRGHVLYMVRHRGWPAQPSLF